MRDYLKLWLVGVVAVSSCVYEDEPQTRFESLPLESYYQGIEGQDSKELRKELHQLIENHVSFPYSSVATDTWDVLEEAQRVSGGSGHFIRDIYKNKKYKVSQALKKYSREHSWPKSYGFVKEGSTNHPHNDCHALFLADGGYNSSRGNRPYDTCTENCSAKPTTGGGSPNFVGGNVWETWDGRRGDVARALFYMDVRYEGGENANNGSIEPDLRLTDNPSLIESSKENEKVGYMGYLSTLLEWHQQDPPDAFERKHNEVVFSFQGNRNPFVDHPEWVECVYLGMCADWSELQSTPIHFTELHYENEGKDQQEFVEVSSEPGASLAGIRVIAYSSLGKPYQQKLLSGKMPKSGFLAVPMVGIQNGASDGLALVNARAEIWDAISYEGPLVAKRGPAAGVVFEDIGVNEDGTTSKSQSLQLVSGTWVGPVANTRGARNSR